ncbi:hypothetical protein GCM10008906_25240 [Clostridium oceanicum]|uniref:Uncharacterized protein n=1 Tax=Clostridium oceanicum TaxID=1543 RepID=A0ABP3UY61_9CLOT
MTTFVGTYILNIDRSCLFKDAYMRRRAQSISFRIKNKFYNHSFDFNFMKDGANDEKNK